MRLNLIEEDISEVWRHLGWIIDVVIGEWGSLAIWCLALAFILIITIGKVRRRIFEDGTFDFNDIVPNIVDLNGGGILIQTPFLIDDVFIMVCARWNVNEQCELLAILIGIHQNLPLPVVEASRDIDLSATMNPLECCWDRFDLRR